MRLGDLLTALSEREVHADPDLEISGLTYDSRRVAAGNLFVALVGTQVDGHRFLPHVRDQGAVAAVVQRGHDAPGFPHVVVPDTRAALALLSSAWFQFPARRLVVIGITGTDGKTTTVNLTRSILEAAGHKVGMVSTIDVRIGEEVFDSGFHTTTPDAPAVQAFLARMAAAGSHYAVLETSSHGLSQHRTLGCEYDVAAITNVTHDHMDYHRDYDDYLHAKGRLFASLASSYRKDRVPKVSVLNVDDQSFAYLRQFAADRLITYGLQRGAAVTASNVVTGQHAQVFTLHTPHWAAQVRLALPGRFNVYNALAAASIAVGLDLPAEAVIAGLGGVTYLLGRVERIDEGQDFTVFVDFAHTPNGLRAVLSMAREAATGRVIAVFGCTGGRDSSKRPMMGKVAGELADLMVLTTEDPRFERVEDITDQIVEGCEAAGAREGERYWRITDREEAIRFAFSLARAGDVVALTGKGHEQFMTMPDAEMPWSDQEVARQAIRDLLSADGLSQST